MSSLAFASDSLNELSPCFEKSHCAFIELKVDDLQISFKNAEKAIQNLQRTEIVNKRPLYLQAVSKTRWMHFLDDIEINGIPERNSIQIRSESRIGVSDFGVNQRRLDYVLGLIGS